MDRVVIAALHLAKVRLVAESAPHANADDDVDFAEERLGDAIWAYVGEELPASR